jgi:RNA polymerase sigma factor (sigma-70 family)
MHRVIQRLLADFGPDGMTDDQLLARFLSNRDDDALAALVRRHAPMVWGVSSRLLYNHQDAEDAFQATFLVLVRKAAAVPRQAVANWLYGVARQTAVRLRATAAKRGRRETQVVNMPEPGIRGQESSDLQSVVDEELGRLPDHYRGVLVLCDLESMTRREAARQLGIPEGSVASRLARARVMLAKRLTQRGVAFSGGSVAAVLSAESASAAPPALVASTIKAASLLAAGQAAGVISAKVAALAEGTMTAMFVTKIKSVLAGVLVVGLALGGIGAGLIFQTQAAGQPAPPSRAPISTPPNQGVREAATRAVGLIDRTSANFLTTRTCFTCHTQTLSAMVLRDARKVGIEIDDANFKRQYQRAIEDMTGTRVDTKGHMLWALDLGQYAPDDKTEATVEYILNHQKHHGTWTTTVDRPPAEASDFTTNYVALRGLNRYGTAKQREAIAARATAVKTWLESANAVDTQDQVFRLRLAHELKLPTDKVDRYVQRLLSEQEADGGWAQNRQMKSDAYATGSVLVALHEAGGLPCQHSAWQRGLAYLLRTQKPDGSWHVVSRAKPLMEYFESGFPHGKDQFISIFATGWATEALLMSLAPEHGEKKQAQPKPPSAKTDQERMVGGWVIVKNDGERNRNGEGWFISEDEILMHAMLSGLRVILHFHRLDASKNPKQIDITVTKTNKEHVGIIKGIYAFDSDTELRLCLGEMGKDRPTEFAGKSGQSEFLILHGGNPVALQRKAAKEEKLRALIDKALAAHGGEDKLNKLTSFSMQVKHSNLETQHYFVQAPKNFRWETTHPDRTGKRIVILFPEGRRWWTKEPNEGAKEFRPTGREPLSVAGWFDYVKFFGPRQVLRLKDADHKVALLDEEAKIGGRAAVGVQVTGPHYNHPMYFDKETHLLLKSVGVNLREATYSDYQAYGGIPVARKENDGYFMPEITDFRAVEKFDAEFFEQPDKEAPAQAKQPAKSDRERMVGNWFITNEDSKRKGEMWVINEDDILMNAKNTSPIVHRNLHRLDAGKDPKQIDITVKLLDGRPVGVIKGIWALDGDELRLCLAALDKDRPAAFPKKPGTGEVLILRRGK